MFGKIFCITFIILALLMGILTVLLPSDRLSDFMVITKFFISMLPILGVGALIKYLMKHE